MGKSARHASLAGRGNLELDTRDTGAKHTPQAPAVSDELRRTIMVEPKDRRHHPLYGKIIRTTNKVKAHDENDVAR